ncbi:hypothetical protein Alsa1_CDS0058 [Staphylococcus phage Alsa_1]|nr:hypothetical protein Alsa1_CDS0058 [Staphylococcus phage Alsa_1]
MYIMVEYLFYPINTCYQLIMSFFRFKCTITSTKEFPYCSKISSYISF